MSILKSSLADAFSAPPEKPGAASGVNDLLLQSAIGHSVRNCRARHGMTMEGLAAAANISTGMLSKLENGKISPSLTTLQSVSTALGMPLTAFFQCFDSCNAAVFTAAGRGRRQGENRVGLAGAAAEGIVVKSQLITLADASDTFPADRHAGMVFLYVLDGEIVYRHAAHLYRLTRGDSLFFDAEVPHGPQEILTFPLRLLAVGSVCAKPRKRASALSPECGTRANYNR